MRSICINSKILFLSSCLLKSLIESVFKLKEKKEQEEITYLEELFGILNQKYVNNFILDENILQKIFQLMNKHNLSFDQLKDLQLDDQMLIKISYYWKNPQVLMKKVGEQADTIDDLEKYKKDLDAKKKDGKGEVQPSAAKRNSFFGQVQLLKDRWNSAKKVKDG